jgi:FkbM family methyltransferase
MLNTLPAYIADPTDPERNWDLAREYQNMGHTAAAVSFYIRCAERSEDHPLLQYEALIKASRCYTDQGRRGRSVRGLLIHAISIFPKRPEAYYLYAIQCEKEDIFPNTFFDSYLFCSIALDICIPDKELRPLRTDVGYPGRYALLFQKGHVAWHTGRCDESRDIFIDLLQNYQMPEGFRKLAEQNFQTITGKMYDAHWHYNTPAKKRVQDYMIPDLKDFDWGIIEKNTWFKKRVTEEIFVNNIYQKYFQIEEGDVVLDVGASAGPFTHFIQKQKPSRVVVVEPHKELFKTLQKNLSQYDNVTYINKGIGAVDGVEQQVGLFNENLVSTSVSDNLQDVETITFESLILENNITKIDFLKLDCEGGEYDILNAANKDWIRNNVRKIAGEFHLTSHEDKKRFAKFKELYLTDEFNFRIEAVNHVDITNELELEWFINYYALVTIYIDNRYAYTKELDGFEWGPINKNEQLANGFAREIFLEKCYEKHVQVNKGDIVLDIGASNGIFLWSLKDKQPGRVICLEPSKGLFDTLETNAKQMPFSVVPINKGIGTHDGDGKQQGVYYDGIDAANMTHGEEQELELIALSTLVKEQRLTQVDYLKIDCEGGEYSLFTKENVKWLKNNVRKIVGEFHINTEYCAAAFAKFRDEVFPEFDNIIIENYYGEDITAYINEDWFISKYDFVNIYIDNRKTVTPEKWKYSIAPTMEVTTTVPPKGCVVDCVFCPQRTLINVYKGERRMSLDNFKRAVDKIPQEVRITFAGFTEPWLHKQCSDMVLYAHDTGHPVSVFTTAVGMSIEDIEKIKHIPFAGNPNGNFTLHLPDQERKAKHPITKQLIEVFEHFGKIQHEIHNFCIMTMGNEVHESIRHVFPAAPTYAMWSRAGNLMGESILKPELLNEKYNSIYHQQDNMTCGCDERLYHNIMLPNGDIALCCMDYGLDHITGNIYEQSYEDVIPEPYQCFELCKYCENAMCLSNPRVQSEIEKYGLNVEIHNPEVVKKADYIEPGLIIRAK